MKKLIILLSLVFVFLWGCVFKLENENVLKGNSYLAVNANFTDTAEEQVVQLSLSANSTTSNSNVEKISGAKVNITDEQGNIINFNEILPGKYVVFSKGEPGRKYILNIELANGKKYHSLPELMPKVPEIKNLYYKFEVDDTKNDYRKYGYNVYVDFDDPSSQGDFYQWTWKFYNLINICKICEKGKTLDPIQNCVDITQALNNNNINNDGLNNFQCDGNCWDIDRSDGFDLLSDHYYNGQTINGIKIHRANFVTTLGSKYYLQIQQRKINKSAYLYLKSLQSQIKSNGTLFDVPAQTQFNFNVFSDTNPNEKILGIFNVYSYQEKILKIPINIPYNGINPASGNLFKFPYQEGFPLKTVVADCENGFSRTSVMPRDWE